MPPGDAIVLRDALLRRADTEPDRLAFAHRGTELTYAGLAERASARARAVQASGVGQGDRVALAMSAGLPLTEVLWGLELLGAVPCVMNPAVPDQTLARRIELVRPTLVVTDQLAAEMDLEPAEAPDRDISPEDLAFLQLTSGTSGEPRASMVRHRNALAYLRTSSEGGQFDDDDVFVSWVPPWHDLGLVRFVLGTPYYGVSCHIIEPAVKTIPEWFETIARVGGTLSAAPDFAFRLAIRMVDREAVDLSSLRFITSGGEPVRWSSIEAFETHFGLEGVVMPGYGLGEATLGVTTHVPGEQIPVDERGNVSCGKSRYGLEIRAGSSLNEPAEIVVRGETVFAGYFDEPDETAEKLRGGWLHTGDTGYLDSEGHLFVLGRREGMIKRAGGIVAPRELEEAALEVPAVRLAAAVSVPGPEPAGDTVVIVVEADEHEGDSAERIAADVSRRAVAALGFGPRVHVVPRRTIPRTENGKIRHGALREMLAGLVG